MRTSAQMILNEDGNFYLDFSNINIYPDFGDKQATVRQLIIIHISSADHTCGVTKGDTLNKDSIMEAKSLGIKPAAVPRPHLIKLIIRTNFKNWLEGKQYFL